MVHRGIIQPLSRGRVKLVATLPSSGATRTGSYSWLSFPAAEGDKRGLDVTSRTIMSSQPAVGDKRSALDAPDTDDDGCASHWFGTGVEVPAPCSAQPLLKKLRQDGGAHNLSRPEERKTAMASIRQIEEMQGHASPQAETRAEAPVTSGPLPVHSPPPHALPSVYPPYSHVVGRSPQEKIFTKSTRIHIHSAIRFFGLSWERTMFHVFLLFL